MDRASILDHLAKAGRHVAQGARALARQRAVIEKLQRGGHRTQTALDLLRQLEETQALNVSDLKRIRAELARS